MKFYAFVVVSSIFLFGNDASAAPVPPETKLITAANDLLDVTPNHPCYEAVRSLVERYGILSATADSRFRPDAPLQRGAFAVWLNNGLNHMAELTIAIEGDLAPLDEKDRAEFAKTLFPPAQNNLGYGMSDITDAKALEGKWYAEAFTGLINKFQVDLGQKTANPEAEMTREEVRKIVSHNTGVNDDAMDDIEKRFTGNAPTRTGKITRAESAAIIEAGLTAHMEGMSAKIDKRMIERAKELAAELDTRYKIRLLDENKKILNDNSPAKRVLLLDLAYCAHVYVGNKLNAVRKTPGLTPEKDAQLYALYPSKFTENEPPPGDTKKLSERVDDLKRGDLPLSELAYLSTYDVRLQLPSTDANKPLKFGPDRPVDPAMVKRLVEAILHHDIKQQSESDSATPAMTLKRFLNGLNEFDYKIKTILEK